MPRPSPTSRPPYTSHPLYALRRATIITSIVAFFLNIFAIGALIDYDKYNIPPFLFSIALHFLSSAFILHDLLTYTPPTSAPAVPAPPREDQGQTWPSYRLLVIDFLLALSFTWLFFAVFGAIMNGRSSYYYGRGAETIEAYANLANLVAGILHAVAFWKELIARKQNAWRAEVDLEARICTNCAGACEDVGRGEDARLEGGAEGVRESGPARPSFLARLGKGRAVLPGWAQGGQERGEGEARGSVAGVSVQEPLLDTPDESHVGGLDFQGYGTLEQSVESVASAPSAPETVVKKVEKGKKRLVDIN